MADFLKIDLDQHNQPATVRLCDKVTTITQAYFDKSGATITRFGIDKKPKSFYLTTEELDHLCAAASEYEGRVMQHTVTIAERKEAAIAEAKALAKSVQFDLDSLNVRAKRDGDSWHIVVTAIGYETYCNTENLKDTVQMALDRIKSDVESAENWHWHGDWDQIVASYRKVFPLQTEQGELSPEAINAIQDLTAAIKEANENYVNPEGLIAQARELLTEAGLTNWLLEPTYPGTNNDCYCFEIEPEGGAHVAFLNKPAADILELVSQYITETLAEQGQSDEMIAGFWARYRFTTDTEQAPELSALPE